MSSRAQARLVVIAAVAAFAVGALLYLLGGLSSLEEATLQARFELRQQPHPRGIVIVAIDDNSFGRLRMSWPFPRSLDGRAVTALHADGVREIVYDIQFTQPTTPSQDNALIQAIRRAGGAVLATTTVTGRGGTDVLGGAATLAYAHSQPGDALYGTSTGGAIERLPYANDGLRSLAVVAAERATGKAVPASSFPRGGALIDYQGPPGASPPTFPTVSFSDVVQHRVDPALLRGRIAIIGATAPSLQDLHVTPVSSKLMPGVEIQANALWTVLHGLPLGYAPAIVALVLIALLACAAPVAWLRWRPLPVAAGAVGLGAVYLGVAQAAFDAGLVLPVVPPLASLVLGIAAMVAADERLEAAARNRLARQLYEAQLELIRRLGQAAESRDRETGEHLERIARLTKLLGRAAGMSEHESEMLRHASLIHDIGKVGIPDRVLLKTGRLTDEERRLMNTHTVIGGDILAGSDSELVQMAEAVALTHHERWDGSGYPHGLRGEEIPLAGRITAICDVYDALVTHRVYKPAWPLEETVEELRRLSGHAFDPRLVELFLAMLPTLDRDLLGSRAAEAQAPEYADAAPVL